MKIWEHFLEGLKNHYPLCCIIAYCLGAKSGFKGVIIRNGNLNDCYVPCFFHKKKAISHLRHIELLNNGDVSWLSMDDFDSDGNLKNDTVRIFGEKWKIIWG